MDPTLQALVPRGSWLRSGSLVVTALLLLVSAWFLPGLLQPRLLGATGGGASVVVGPGKRVVATALLQPHGLGGVRVTAIDPVPGAHVVDAWVVDGWRDPWTGTTTTPTADATLAALGAGPAAQVPLTVPSGESATLVMLWQVDDCAALTADGPVVHVASPWATRTERLPWSPVGTSSPPDANPVCNS